MVIRLLKSVIACTYKEIEVIVIDDASTDGTSDAIRKTFPQNRKICVVRNQTNLYAAGSRNAGTKKSKGKYLFYVDDDNVLDKYAISELVRVFEDDERIGELGLVNYSFRDKNQVIWLTTGRNMWTSKTYLPADIGEYSGNKIWNSVDVPNSFIIRADVLKKHKISFCKKFGIMYEESDVAYRIRNAGYSIKVVRDAKIYHDVGDYMYHFMNDPRRPYVFARNRIIFHSLYSNKFQMLSIVLVWIWAFALYYSYQMVCYSGAGNFSFGRRMYLVLQYLRGNIEGILFVLRGEKLQYS